MADHTAWRESPLAHLYLDPEGLLAEADTSLREVPYLTMVGIRVDPGGPAGARLATVLGAALPDRCAATSSHGPHTALWLGPDEWLVVSTDEPEALTEALVDALGDSSGAVIDVSANRTTLELSGPHAREALEKGCAADLHPRRFHPGMAITATVGPVPLLLWQTTPDTYRLLPRSSFAAYLVAWLRDALLEFGLHEDIRCR